MGILTTIIGSLSAAIAFISSTGVLLFILDLGRGAFYRFLVLDPYGRLQEFMWNSHSGGVILAEVKTRVSDIECETIRKALHQLLRKASCYWGSIDYGLLVVFVVDSGNNKLIPSLLG